MKTVDRYTRVIDWDKDQRPPKVGQIVCNYLGLRYKVARKVGHKVTLERVD